MLEKIYLGFDFGFKRIGVAVGQTLTFNATPLPTLRAINGIPDWAIITKLIQTWQPNAFVVGYPLTIDNKKMIPSKASKRFAQSLENKFCLPTYMVDERLTTKEARSQLFEFGGYKAIKKMEVDSVAACLILEQWMANAQNV